MRNDETGKKDCSRRNFLQTVGAGVPTLKLMLNGVAGAAPPAVRPEPPFDPNQFTPLDISRHLTATARDGGEETFPIRRRFEVNSPSVEWGHQCYAALPHVREAPRKLHEALPDATMWGHVQLGVGDDLPSEQSPPAFIWVWPLSNPEPERNLKALRLKAASEDPLMVCGLTLYHGKENPLRLAPLHVHRITLPEPTAGEPGRWSLGVDLGVVARSYTLNDFDAESWLAAPGKGLGERKRPV